MTIPTLQEDRAKALQTVDKAREEAGEALTQYECGLLTPSELGNKLIIAGDQMREAMHQLGNAAAFARL